MFSECCFASLTQIQKKHKAAKDKIRRLKILETRETNKLYKNQLKLEQTSSALIVSKDRYVKILRNLERTQNEYNIALKDYADYEIECGNRIKKIFKKERNGVLEFLLNSNDFSDFLDRIYFQKILVKADKQRLDNLKAKADRIAKLKQQIDEQKRLLARSIEEMSSQKQFIKNAISQNESIIHRLKTDRKTYERAERELARQSAQIQSMISKGSKSTAKVSGGFMWPIKGPITSPFGYRVHPIFKSRTFHSGLDIAAAHGKPIAASNSGKVIFVGWYSGYGKVVIIDHGTRNGKSITTLYAHMSRYNVKNGQNVSKGQTIGFIGTTGYSTGPHLHFEVRINGKVQNPLNYL